MKIIRMFYIWCEFVVRRSRKQWVYYIFWLIWEVSNDRSKHVKSMIFWVLNLGDFHQITRSTFDIIKTLIFVDYNSSIFFEDLPKCILDQSTLSDEMFMHMYVCILYNFHIFFYPVLSFLRSFFIGRLALPLTIPLLAAVE